MLPGCERTAEPGGVAVSGWRAENGRTHVRANSHNYNREGHKPWQRLVWHKPEGRTANVPASNVHTQQGNKRGVAVRNSVSRAGHKVGCTNVRPGTVMATRSYRRVWVHRAGRGRMEGLGTNGGAAVQGQQQQTQQGQGWEANGRTIKEGNPQLATQGKLAPWNKNPESKKVWEPHNWGGGGVATM